MMDARHTDIVTGGGCCPTPPAALPRAGRIDTALIQDLGDGRAHIDVLVPDMHCATCMRRIEERLTALPGVIDARANFTAHRVGIGFDRETGDPEAMLTAIERLGYTPRPFDAEALQAAARDDVGRDLLRAMAVAGFAAGNVMLLSISVWSGADPVTRDLFHWISALIALPAIAYAGRPFFRSAFAGLRAGTLTMDLPISLAVVLAAGMSLAETAAGAPHAYFDAAITLLFFLLVGRFLDHRMRSVAHSAAAGLMTLAPRSALRIDPDGTTVMTPITEICVGDRIRVTAGDRVPVDGTVTEGGSDIDRALLTGEPEPEPVAAGASVFAGTLNLTGPLVIRVTATAGDTLLAEITRLVAAAEQAGGRSVRLADRAARIYAPAVHIVALATLIAWLALGAGWHTALTTAIAVLIIACPCALGLAVPAVQVAASTFLLKRGIMLKDGAALERLAGVDTVIFDKTGTLTAGEPHIIDPPAIDPREWSIAAALGQASRHPFAGAVARAATDAGVSPALLADIVEYPGQGMSGRIDHTPVRLGRRDWVGGIGADAGSDDSEIWLRIGDGSPRQFRFDDEPRRDAAAAIARLKQTGLRIVLASGDRPAAVARLADRLGIADWHADQRPTDKARLLAEAEAAGRTVLMVGDGINDAPALAAAHVSMSPASGAAISQSAADIVFTGQDLAPVAVALRVASTARRLTFQNFALALGYNLIAVPVAVLGFATPLVAAIAMSSSSIVVTANALRLGWIAGRPRHRPASAEAATEPAEAVS